jgi:hypothetical protein
MFPNPHGQHSSEDATPSAKGAFILGLVIGAVIGHGLYLLALKVVS